MSTVTSCLAEVWIPIRISLTLDISCSAEVWISTGTLQTDSSCVKVTKGVAEQVVSKNKSGGVNKRAELYEWTESKEKHFHQKWHV